jgi:outer membrane lipoprotein carrier protein
VRRPVRALAVLALALLALPSTAAAADEALARIDAYLAGLRTLSAEFTQVVRDREDRIVERAAGTLHLSRPDRFRWDYREPHPQLIVADGERLWLYDSDLEQVTVRVLEDGLGATPAALLSGSGRLAESFVDGGVERAGDWTWYRLAPRVAATSDFERVALALDARGELAAMELRDKLGQRTLLEFRGLRRNVSLDPALFRFEPPPGADVIGRAAP